MAVAIVYVKLSQHFKTDQKNSENFKRCTRLDNAQFTVDRMKELLFVKFRIAPPQPPTTPPNTIRNNHAGISTYLPVYTHSGIIFSVRGIIPILRSSSTTRVHRKI